MLNQRFMSDLPGSSVCIAKYCSLHNPSGGKILSTRSLLFYLAPIDQPISAEAREHEIVGHNASFIAKVFDMARYAQALG